MMADAAFLPAMQQVKAPGVLHTLVTEEFASWYGGFDGADPRTRAAIDDTALQQTANPPAGGRLLKRKVIYELLMLHDFRRL